MQKKFSHFVLSLTKINPVHIQFALMVLTLVMLVIGAGAPEDVGDSRR